MSSRHGAELVPLREAAKAVQERLFPDRSDRDPKVLDTIAFALSELMPIYTVCPEGAHRELTEAEILAGRFKCNAVVSPRDLERAIAALRFDCEDARATLTLRQSSKAGGRARPR